MLIQFRSLARSRTGLTVLCNGVVAALLQCASLPVLAQQDDPARASDASLMAHWTFDETDGAVYSDLAGDGYHAAADDPRQTILALVAGVHGRALDFAGPHKLYVRESFEVERLAKISFSAWALPVDLSGYREIFRKEDGHRRVLFSFQQSGRILSLGLNIGGYVECDAPLEVAAIMDGQWHHLAGTFDGETMRVYFDGQEIGCLRRPGKILAGGPAPACIGSSNGGECFQGSLDELRIYGSELSAHQVDRLYREGLRSLARSSQRVAELLDRYYRDENTFAKTLAGLRRGLRGQGIELDRELANAVLARLKSEFPAEYVNFVSWTGVSPKEYLAASGTSFQVQQTRRLVELMLEYQPLTESQIARLGDGDRATWAQAESIRRRLDRLVARGDKAADSPEWLEVMFAAGRRVCFRPRVQEAVAPYIVPSTPVTRDMTEDEARAALERDWLHQADQQPTVRRILDEIHSARSLADRLANRFPGRVDLSRELAQLERLAEIASSRSAPNSDLYFRVRQVKRAIAFSNPVIDFRRVLFVDMPFPQGSEWRHETRHRLGYMAVPGGRLLVLDGLSPGGRLTKLMPQPPLHGSFWRPDVSFDGTRVLFCFKPHNEKSFHLYEINVDGTGFRQLTDGPYDDLDPIYLPDEKHVVFTTTRGNTYVRCMPPTNAFVLARCDRDGRDIYLVSRNNEPDYLPSVLADGRVIYTRWEYTDKPLWRAQSLWTANPDGTGVSTFWGNQSVWPDLLKDARGIPDSERVMFIGSAHHNWFSGSVGIIDPSQGLNFPAGLTKVTADVDWPESGNGPVDPVESADYHASGSYAAYDSPYPLSEEEFLVSADRQGKFVLYLMDVHGNRELIYEGHHNIFYAVPLRPRIRPPVLPDQVAWPRRDRHSDPREGMLYSNDVYEGVSASLRGRAAYLRVLNIDPKTYTYWHKRPYISTGPVVSMVQSEGIKRVLGTVPIEKDGSVAFFAPAGIALHFQLLDEQYRALHTMRSFTGVMPGESRGCTGCHESHSRAPQQSSFKSLALRRPPSVITPLPWSDNTVSFDRYVQPALDKYCGECHQGAGEARATLDLTSRPGFLIFNEPYVTLTGSPTWGTAYQRPEKPRPGWGIADTLMVEGFGKTDPAAYRTPPPMSALSYASRLVELASSGSHYDVRVDPIHLRRLKLWVDTMCPYRGEEEVRSLADPDFQGIDWLAIRPRIQSAPRIVRPGPVD